MMNMLKIYRHNVEIAKGTCYRGEVEMLYLLQHVHLLRRAGWRCGQCTVMVRFGGSAEHVGQGHSGVEQTRVGLVRGGMAATNVCRGRQRRRAGGAGADAQQRMGVEAAACVEQVEAAGGDSWSMLRAMAARAAGNRWRA